MSMRSTSTIVATTLLLGALFVTGTIGFSLGRGNHLDPNCGDRAACTLRDAEAALSQRQYAKARELFESLDRKSVSKENKKALWGLARSNLYLGHYAEADRIVERMQRLYPYEAEVDFFLARLRYEEEDLVQSLMHVERGLAHTRADPHLDTAGMAQFRSKVVRDFETEKRYARLDLPHIRLKYDPERRPEEVTFLKSLLTSSHQHIAQTLGIPLLRPITVVLYAKGDFERGAEGPSWRTALYDGKLRIPPTSDLRDEVLTQSVLHEMTHAFLHQNFGESLPNWFNEGIAQLLAQDRSIDDLRELRRMQEDGKVIPLRHLGHDFVDLERWEAKRAYFESYVALLVLFEHGGFVKLRQLLIDVRQSDSFEQALANIYGWQMIELEVAMRRRIAAVDI